MPAPGGAETRREAGGADDAAAAEPAENVRADLVNDFLVPRPTCAGEGDGGRIGVGGGEVAGTAGAWYRLW